MATDLRIVYAVALLMYDILAVSVTTKKSCWVYQCHIDDYTPQFPTFERVLAVDYWQPFRNWHRLSLSLLNLLIH